MHLTTVFDFTSGKPCVAVTGEFRRDSAGRIIRYAKKIGAVIPAPVTRFGKERYLVVFHTYSLKRHGRQGPLGPGKYTASEIRRIARPQSSTTSRD